MIASGAVKVHVGEDARKLIEAQGTKRLLESRYVYTTTDGKDSGPLKARWCIRGYLDPDILDLATAAPTLSPEGFATIVQMITSKRWHLKIADIEAAFLRGDDMKRTQGKVLVRVPRDGIPQLAHDAIIELIKPVYGLADAPRLWWKSLTKSLVELGMTQSRLDACVFHYRRPGDETLQGVIAFHVDDLLIGGSQGFYQTVFEKLRVRYPFQHVKDKRGEFLGKQLVQCDHGVLVIQQKEYAEAMNAIPVSKERRREKDKPVTENERGQMRAVLGEINWLVSGSRPDLAASCSLMQQRVSGDVVGDLTEVNKVVSQVHDYANIEIRILPIPVCELEIGVWSDASFANAESHKSQGGTWYAR